MRPLAPFQNSLEVHHKAKGSSSLGVEVFRESECGHRRTSRNCAAKQGGPQSATLIRPRREDERRTQISFGEEAILGFQI